MIVTFGVITVEIPAVVLKSKTLVAMQQESFFEAISSAKTFLLGGMDSSGGNREKEKSEWKFYIRMFWKTFTGRC